jgi:two-component system alkaline phosphatase synthesis response regulator PhoP
MTRVLVVDDEPAIRLLARVNLEADGMEVLEAGDGETAVTQARGEQPDLILLDVVMPRIDGLEVARRLRGDERTRDIPIVFMSGLVELPEEAAGRGDDVLVKPFDPLGLAAFVEQTLGRGREAAGG